MHYNCFYKLCRNFGNNVRIYVSVSASDTSHQVEDEIVDTSMIHWPFVIVGSFSIFSALILAILLCLPFRIPVYEETRQSQISMEANGNSDQKQKRVTVAEGQALLFRLCFNLQTYKAHSSSSTICARHVSWLNRFSFGVEKYFVRSYFVRKIFCSAREVF